ncbi:MAG: hypothetical protein KBD78_09775, partial [Oligoflexales bacterium]|nr:hypothetical protein [Oligoflexales bacterium]
MTVNRKKSKKNFLSDVRALFGLATLFLLLFCGIFAKQLASYAVDEIDITKRLCSPSVDHWLGCDIYGGDILSSILYGAQTTIYISFTT